MFHNCLVSGFPYKYYYLCSYSNMSYCADCAIVDIIVRVLNLVWFILIRSYVDPLTIR